MTKEIVKQEEKEQKNKGGRPRVFSTPEEMQVLIDEYFEIKGGHTRMMVLKNGTIVHVPDPEPVHIAGLCAYLGLTSETLRQYQEQKEFSAPIKAAKQLCEEYAVTMCFKGKNKADFVLQNNFGWRNRSESENKNESTTKIIYVEKGEKDSYEDHIKKTVEE